MSTIKVTIAQLADAVSDASAFNGGCTPAQLAHVLEIGLKTQIGMNCLGGRTVDVDLGNGHVLHCAVKRTIGPADV